MLVTLQLLLWALAAVSSAVAQSVDATLTLALTNSIVQQQSDYTFNLVLVFNDPLVVGSIVEITFPAEYVSNSTTSYACSLTNWPFPVATPVQCQITNRVLTLTGAFTQQYVVTSDTIFEFVVRAITNPMFAGDTSFFSGRVAKPDLTTIVSISQQYITISPGSLSAQLTVSPAIVSTLADLTITISTTHPLPGNARLRLYTATNTWGRANSISPETIFATSPSCNAVNNTLPNLYCEIATSSSQRTITVYNINSQGAQASATPTTFSFRLSSIRTAPTTEPQGSFSLTIQNSASKSVDSGQNNKIGGLSPKEIMSPSLSLSTYVVGEAATATLRLSINSIIEPNDMINIQFPNCISLASLGRITVESTQIPTYSVNTNILGFSGVQVVTSIPITIVLTSITNPLYVVDVATLGSVFRIWTSRNGYKIDEKISPFSYVTTPGDLNCSNLSALSTQAGMTTSFTLPLSFQHSISRETSLQIVFPSDSFSILMAGSPTLSCSSNLSPSCSLMLLANNLMQLSNVVASNNINSYSNVVITLHSVPNPIQVGLFTGLQVSTYDGAGYLVDRDDSIEGFVVTARVIAVASVALGTTSNVVNGISSISLTVTTNNPIAIYSHILLYVPLQLDTTGLSCTPFCSYQSTSTHSIYQLDVSSFYQPGNRSILSLVLANIRNPKSTRPTQSFQLYLYNTMTSSLLEFIASGLEYRLCTLPASLSITLTRNSTRNSQQTVLYTFGLAVGFVYSASEPVLARLEVPNELACSGCIISSSNSTSYTTSLSSSASGAPILLAPSATLSLLLSNHYSLEPKSVAITMMTSDQAYLIAWNSVPVINTQPNTINVSYSFVPAAQQFLSSTVLLTLSSLTVTQGAFAYLDIHFGGEFDATSASLASGTNQYSLTVMSAVMLRLTKKIAASNSSNADLFSINGIRSPSFTPSSSIFMETFTASGYFKIDKTSSPIIWQTSCTLPCRECSPTLPSSCQSCYSDGLMVMSRVLLFLNGSTSTCLSACPDLYYKRSTTNSCEPCSTACGNCEQYEVCTSCPALLPYILTLNSSSVCYSNCPLSYYESNETQPWRCLQCSSALHCLSCSNYVTCDSCLSGYYFYLAQCLPACPGPTTVSNEFTRVCEPCPINCSTCSRDTSVLGTFYIKCLTCQPGFLLDRNRCYQSCVTYGLVPDPATGACCSCDPTCLTCSLSKYNCTTCNTTSANPYFLSNRCLSTCPPGQYPSSLLSLCLPCSGPCEYCTSSSVSSCLSCITGYSLYGSVCRNACPEGYYQNGSQCVRCASQCTTCSSLSVCLSCADGYSLFAGQDCRSSCPDGYAVVNRVCLQCSTNCRTCSLVNFCSSCFPSMYLHQGLCTDPCPSKYFKNVTVCSPCPYECSECLGPLLCQSCIAGYELMTGSGGNVYCNSTCQLGYVPIDGVCEGCALGCSQCTYRQDNCTTCIAGYYLYKNIMSSSLGTFINICYQACPISLFAYSRSYWCLETCPAGTFANITYSTTNSSMVTSKECLDCPSLCATCSGLLVCLSCTTGASLFNSTCYSTCPPSYPFSVAGTCQSCNIVECYECSQSTCIQCNTNYLLILADGINMCLSSCSTGMIYNPAARKCELISNSTSNTTNATMANGTIKFIPVPYCIAGAAMVVVVLALHWAQGVQIYGNLFGLLGVLLQLSLITCTAVLGASTISEITSSITARLLATTEVVFGSKVSHRILIALIALCAIVLMVNVICWGLYFYKVRIKRYRIVALSALLFSSKLFGSLLCSDFYGVNMKDIKEDKLSKQKKEDEDFDEKTVAEAIKFTQQQYVNVGKDKYARSQTRNPSRIKVLNHEQSKLENNQNQKRSSKINSNKRQQKFSIKISQQVPKIVPSGSQKKGEGSKKVNSGKEKNIKQSINSQSINSSFYRPSQIHSLPNPNFCHERKKQKEEEYVEPFIEFNKKETLSKFSSKLIGMEKGLNSENVLEKNHSVKEIEKQYREFWRIYDRIILIHIPIDVALVTCGVLLCFNVENTYYEFFGGIEISLLGVIDLILTALWRAWNHESINQKLKTRGNKYGYKYEEDESMVSALSKEKLFKQDDQQDDPQNQKQKIFGQNVQQQNEQQIIFDKSESKKLTKTEIEYKIENEDSRSSGYGMPQEKDYKSQYARPIDVIKLEKQKIAEAIEEGVYRHDKRELANKHHQLLEESKLDSAQKFNKAEKDQKETSKQNKVRVDRKQIKDSPLGKENGQSDEKSSDKKEIQIELEEDKQINEIIFENYDQESMDTHPDNGQEDESQGMNKERKRKDSLGSQKNERKICQVIQIEPVALQEKAQMQNRAQRLNTPVQIMQIENNIITHRKKPQLLAQKLEQIPSKQLTNIFENDFINESQYNDGLKETKMKGNNESEQLQVIDLKNVYQVKQKNSKILAHAENKYRMMEGVKKTKIIFADLESVGTVSEYDMKDYQHESSKVQPFNTLQVKGKSAFQDEKGLQFQGDIERPSNFIDINFNYHSKKQKGRSVEMPQKLTISRPKKLSKKRQDNSRLIN